jgi:hypothetical protein
VLVPQLGNPHFRIDMEGRDLVRNEYPGVGRVFSCRFVPNKMLMSISASM